MVTTGFEEKNASKHLTDKRLRSSFLVKASKHFAQPTRPCGRRRTTPRSNFERPSSPSWTRKLEARVAHPGWALAFWTACPPGFCCKRSFRIHDQNFPTGLRSADFAGRCSIMKPSALYGSRVDGVPFMKPSLAQSAQGLFSKFQNKVCRHALCLGHFSSWAGL
jgi:hypothetical protein